MHSLRFAKWEPSDIDGLLVFHDGLKRWFRCCMCSYLNNRAYHSRMHYQRVHVNGGKAMVSRRKFSTYLSPHLEKISPTAVKQAKAVVNRTKPIRHDREEVAKRLELIEQDQAAVECVSPPPADQFLDEVQTEIADQFFGEDETADQFFGEDETADQFFGEDETADQFFGEAETAGQLLGEAETSLDSPPPADQSEAEWANPFSNQSVVFTFGRVGEAVHRPGTVIGDRVSFRSADLPAVVASMRVPVFLGSAAETVLSINHGSLIYD